MICAPRLQTEFCLLTPVSKSVLFTLSNTVSSSCLLVGFKTKSSLELAEEECFTKNLDWITLFDKPFISAFYFLTMSANKQNIPHSNNRSCYEAIYSLFLST